MTIVPASKPQRLALASWLNGGPLPNGDPLRLLDVGCGAAHNLLALAYYHPRSSFVGVDHDAVAIGHARVAAEGLGLENLRLEIADFSEVGVDGFGGPFDYVIAHDLYSRLDTDRRKALPCFCREVLSPTGVLYLTADVASGAWLQLAVAQLVATDPDIAQIRSKAAALHAIIANETDHYWNLVAGELRQIADASDAEITLRYIEYTIPPSFSEHIRDIEARGLRYITDASIRHRQPIQRQRLELRRRLEQTDDGLLSIDDALDGLMATHRRELVLCRDDAAVVSPPEPKHVRSFQAVSSLSARNPAPVFHPGVREEFVGADGVQLNTDDPLTKAVLVVLSSRYPRDMVVGQAIDKGLALLGQRHNEVPASVQQRDSLCTNLLELHRIGGVELRLGITAECPPANKQPHRLARLESMSSGTLTAPCHDTVSLDAFAHRTLRALCDEADDEAVIAALVRATVNGELILERNGVRIEDPTQIASLARRALGDCLSTLGDWGLLETA